MVPYGLYASGGAFEDSYDNGIMYLCISIAGQPQIDSQDAKYHSDVASLQHDGPPRGTASSGISDQGVQKSDGTPSAVIPTASTQASSPLTSPPAHAPSTTSEKSLTDSVTSAASDISAVRPHLSSSSSTAGVSSHCGSEVQGTDQRSTPYSTSTTTTTDLSATHSHSTINILLVSKPNTTAQSG